MRITIEGKEIKEGFIGRTLAKHLRHFSVILSTGKVIDIYHYKREKSILSVNKELSGIEKKEYNDIISIINDWFLKKEKV